MQASSGSENLSLFNTGAPGQDAGHNKKSKFYRGIHRNWGGITHHTKFIKSGGCVQWSWLYLVKKCSFSGKWFVIIYNASYHDLPGLGHKGWMFYIRWYIESIFSTTKIWKQLIKWIFKFVNIMNPGATIRA